MVRVRKSANLYLGIVIALILIIAVIVAVTSSNSTKTLSIGSPEKVVQEYLVALNEGRNDLAFKLLASDSSCSIQDLDRAYHSPDAETSLLESKATENTAVVRVSIQYDPYTIIDGSSGEEQTYRLIKEDGQWRISGIPWPLWDCGGAKK
jgi:hypothetical protein